ncbi:Frag1/DRAM/Sfk1 family-domain-containing protein [Aspergillus oleicola]
MPSPNPSPVWSFLHRTILNIPPHRFPLFPLLSGTVWFLTLSSLLLRWITRGRKPYPGQINSSVPFISDIASFELKPLFLVGSSITAAGFFVTVVAVHVVRFEPGFALVQQHQSGHSADGYGGENEAEETERNSNSLHLTSLISITAAGLASLSLTLLAVMDTFRYSIAHDILLRLYFAGLAVQALGTAAVYADAFTGVRRTSKRVRIFGTLSTFLLLTELLLATSFLSLSISDEVDTHYRVAAILEWMIAYLGTVYLWLFVGFFESGRFEGVVPRSRLYQGKDGRGAERAGSFRIYEGDSTREDGDAERAPLLQRAHFDRKYT